MNKRHWSHYDWLEEHFSDFVNKVGSDIGWCGGLVGTHGDKGYQYKDSWKSANIPFSHGMAIYLLTYLPPFSKEVRNTDNGFVQPHLWVIENYNRFKPFLSTEDLEKVA